MANLKYKVGDEVVIIGCKRNHNFSNGDECTIIKVEKRKDDRQPYLLKLTSNKHVQWWCDEEDLKTLIPCDFCEDKPPFKVISADGDLCVRKINANSFMIGYHPHSGMVGLSENIEFNYCPMCGKNLET